MLTVREAALRLRLHPDTIRRMAARGDLPGAVKLGGKGAGRKEWRIPQTDLDNYLGEQQ